MTESLYNAALVPLFRRELELCGVKPGEVVGVLTQNRVRSDYADAFVTAAVELGAKAFHVDAPASRQGPPGEMAGLLTVNVLDDNPVLAEGLARCDLVVDLAYLLWSEAQHKMLRSGVRMLLCVEPVDVLQRCFPTEEIKQRVLADSAALKAASVMQVTSAAGTDLTYQLGQYPVVAQYGFADEPGRWDHFPSALVGTYGNDGDVSGTVVLQPGDELLPFCKYIESPVTLTVSRGSITSIDGAGDANLMRDYLAWFDDERAYAISHGGWCQHPAARPDAHRLGTLGMGMDARSVAGAFLFSTGPNTEGGGDNDTFAHIDIPMYHCSVSIDGQPVVENGRLLPTPPIANEAGAK